MNDTLENLIGDVPVSEQLDAALARMASKEHEHDEYAMRDEVEYLKQKINMLMDLVGDVSVSEQIHMAIENMK